QPATAVTHEPLLATSDGALRGRDGSTAVALAVAARGAVGVDEARISVRCALAQRRDRSGVSDIRTSTMTRRRERHVTGRTVAWRPARLDHQSWRTLAARTHPHARSALAPGHR